MNFERYMRVRLTSPARGMAKFKDEEWQRIEYPAGTSASIADLGDDEDGTAGYCILQIEKIETDGDAFLIGIAEAALSQLELVEGK